jgi:hypothetical protein
MKALWIILSVVGVIIATVAIVIFVGISKIDDLVVTAVERVGSNLTGTEVRLDEADISLGKGKGTLSGLHIGNPEGFSDREAFNLETISFKLDFQSLRETVFKIDEIRVIGAQALVEMNEEGKSNFDVIRAHMNRHDPPKQDKANSGDSGEPAREPMRMQVGVFHSEQGVVETDATAMGSGTRSVDLPSVHLEDIGGELGFTGEELGNAILEAMGDQVLRTAIEEELGNLIDEHLKGDTGKAVKGLLDRFTK